MVSFITNKESIYNKLIEDDYKIIKEAFISTDKKAILHILNSKIADYYIRSLGVTRNGGYFEYKPMFVDKLPVPLTGLEELEEIPSEPTKSQENNISSIIYKLYGLTKTEIDYIESIVF